MGKTRGQGPKRSLVGLREGCLALACIYSVATGTAKAQGSRSVGETEPGSRLLTPNEGRAIVNVAWQEEWPKHGVRDCSHFVHEIYVNAGFEYPYASSFEIYAGNESFARVRYPHAGDLIAWPGHVGIVVDPAQHTFYSLVRTGLQEQDYQSAYWRSRGRPRFFRFRVAGGATLSAAKTPSVTTDSIRGARVPQGPLVEQPEDPAPDRPPNAAPKGSVAKSPARSTVHPPANQNAEALADGERLYAGRRSVDRPPTARAERRSVIYGPPAPPETTDSRVADHALDTEERTPFDLPTSVAIATRAETPTREEMAEGISELSNALGVVLRGDDPFHVPRPVVIVEQFSVEKVEIRRDHGWAHLAVDSKVSIAGGIAQVKRRYEKVRWELRRTESGWEAVPPADCTYVPHDVAVKNLAGQLARLAGSDGAAQHQEAILRQEAQIAGVLNALLERK